jgi:hypothetical protein
MLKIIFCEDGETVSDFNAERTVLEIINNGINEYYTSNEIMINYFRVYVREGKIKHNDIIFVFDGKESRCDKYGSLENYNKFSAFNDSLYRLIEWNQERKNDKNRST